MSEMDVERPTKYIYRPFVPIRLLRLHRDRDGCLQGHLENFNLDDQQCPKFVTLSYVWGRPRYTKTIRIHGAIFPILDNLFPLLEALCDYPCFKNDRWIWIDSICINQEDEHERAQQVQLMGRIYRQSTRTVVWLGTGTLQTDRAIDFLHDLATFMSRENANLPATAMQSETWEDLNVFFRQLWWTRVWTLQEFVLPSALDFHCGKKKIADIVFTEAMQALYYCKEQKGLGDGNVWGTAWGRRRVRRLFKEPHIGRRMSLVALLAFTGNYQCADPRDRIYSLLGLVRERDQAIAGRPNYDPENSVEAVYTNLVINFIQMLQSLDIICFASLFGHQANSEDTEAFQWPSWLPDWRVQIRPQIVPLMVSQPSRSHIGCFRPLPWPEVAGGALPVFSASGSTQPDIQFNISARTLSCKGIYVDKIDGIATGLNLTVDEDYTHYSLIQSSSPTNTTDRGVTALDYQEKTPTGTTNFSAATEVDVVADLIRTLTLDRNSRYLEEVSPIDRFREDLREISLDAAAGFGTDSKSDTVMAWRWFRHNMQFLIRGRSLLKICQSIPSTPYTGPDVLSLPERLLETISLGDKSGNKVLATLYQGHLALVPINARKEDAIYVLQGCSVPVVLRKHLVDDVYSLVGECYVHNFMNGEAFSKGCNVEEVVIR